MNEFFMTGFFDEIEKTGGFWSQLWMSQDKKKKIFDKELEKSTDKKTGEIDYKKLNERLKKY